MEVGRIFAVQPNYGQATYSSVRAFLVGSLLPGSSLLAGRLDMHSPKSSLLAAGFNTAWAEALNSGPNITHFAMLHDDITPQDGWLQILMEDLSATEADMVAAVVPIKDQRGVTSTAIDREQFQVERRITMTELLGLPETFTAADCGYPDRALLLNTGCWVCRFDRPWRFQTCFTIRDRMIYCPLDRPNVKILQHHAADMAVNNTLPPGRWKAEVDPEDWGFSRQLYSLGCKMVASKRVKLHHHANIPMPNDQEWGDYQRDEDLLRGTDTAAIGLGKVTSPRNDLCRRVVGV